MKINISRAVFFSFLLICMCQFALSQKKDSIFFGKRQRVSQAIKDSIEREKVSISSYRFKLKDNYQIIDTTLSIDNYYNQIFNEKDPFGTIEFPNAGQTFNPLTYKVESRLKTELLPTGKSFNLIQEEDVRYFDVKTPTTEIKFENGVKEGQALSTLFTHSTSRNFNYFINYRGLRSLGHYSEQFSANQSLLFGLRFGSDDTKYKVWGHYAAQNINNEENGGISGADLDEFFNNNSDFQQRNRFNTNLNDVESEYTSIRLHINQRYRFLEKKSREDSTKIISSLGLKHTFSLKDQDYLYEENNINTFYTSGLTNTTAARRNEKELNVLNNKLLLEWKSKDFLKLQAGGAWEKLRYENPTEITIGSLTIPRKFETNLYSIIANGNANLNNKFKLDVETEFKTSDDIKPQYSLYANLNWAFINGYNLGVEVLSKKHLQSFNLLMNQSFYSDFNFFNDFDNTENNSLKVELKSTPLKTKIQAKFSNINNLVYVDQNFIPTQEKSSMNLVELEIENTINYKKFFLTSRVAYQKFDSNENLFPIPEIIARGTLYYQNFAFKQNAEIQTGINVYYFSSFNSREFFPVLNEFNLPSSGSRAIGDYPYMDAFINTKVRKMRIYFRLQHFNSLFFDQRFLSDPNNPYRDFKIQLGLKWYLLT